MLYIIDKIYFFHSKNGRSLYYNSDTSKSKISNLVTILYSVSENRDIIFEIIMEAS